MAGRSLGRDNRHRLRHRLCHEGRLRRRLGGAHPRGDVRPARHAVGVSGPAAHALAGEKRASVAIDWPTANAVFAERTLPAYAADTARALSNCDALSGDSFGALVSLVNNRGAGFTKIGDRYTEMRAIKSHMAAKAFTAVPGDIVAMQRLWPAVPGLQKRRRDEAALFRSGLD